MAEPRLVHDWSLPGLDPLAWLGSAAAEVTGDAWTVAMVGLWSAGLWLLKLAMTTIDAITTPDLSPSGPLQPALEITLWLGGSVAALMFCVQLALLMVRRDGQSLGRLLLGTFQFGFVWVSFLGIASAAVLACSGLSRGILRATLQVDTLSAIDWTASWPRNVTDVTTATVLGVTSLLLIIPGAFFDILISFVAEAALLVLVVTSPITAAGLFQETTRAWFWKTARWGIACVLIGPTTALVFGIGVGVSKGVVYGNGDQTLAAVGMAVVGGALVVVGAICPLALFRLLAFIDPATPSGAAMRQSWTDAGGLAGLTGKAAGGTGGAVTGSSAAIAGDGTGRAMGEANAEGATQSRVTSMLGGFGRGMQAATAFATRATDLSADILGSAGVGAPSYSMTPADERALRAAQGGRGAGGGGGRGAGEQPGSDPSGGGSGGPGGSGGGGQPPAGGAPPAPTPPVPASPASSPGGGRASAGGSGGSGGAAGGAGAGAGGAAPVVVP